MPRHNSPHKSVAGLVTPAISARLLAFFPARQWRLPRFFHRLVPPGDRKTEKTHDARPEPKMALRSVGWPSEAWEKHAKMIQKHKCCCISIAGKGPTSISWSVMPHGPAVEAAGLEVLVPNAGALPHRFLVATDFCGKSSPRPFCSNM